MPRTVDLPGLKTRSANLVSHAIARYESIAANDAQYLFARWVAKMTAVEMHAIWERYAENRLVAALNHSAKHFLIDQNIKGVSRVSAGLAFYVVRGGGRYFDFRSMSDLLEKGDRILGKAANPFRSPSTDDRAYMDALASVRNAVVHRSDAAVASYKRCLRSVYGIKSAPEPDEFLHAKDMRATSPARYRSRLHGLATVVARCIQNT
jgi:hypothetical protein